MELAEGLLPFSADDVIARYKDTVYRVAYTYCQNPADAEDVTQEVFIRFIKAPAGFASEEHLKAWLIRVAVNLSKNLLRSAWFRKTVPLPDQETPRPEEETRRHIYDAVMSLPAKYRAVVLLYYFEDYSVREAAEVLRRKETTVQTQLQRARTMLRQMLKEEWQDE